MALTYGSIDKPKIIIIEIEEGCVVNVSGMPQGYTYETKFLDDTYEEKEEE